MTRKSADKIKFFPTKKASRTKIRLAFKVVVGTERVELSWVAPQRPQRCAYTNSATSPQI